jgi:hypothetical protein
MTEQMSLERLVAGWMAEEAGGAPDELLGQILATTQRTRPRPRWWAVLSERPLRTTSGPAAVGLRHRGLVLGLAPRAAARCPPRDRDRGEPAPAASTSDHRRLAGLPWRADRQGAGLTGPVGRPVTAWRFQATGGVLEVALARRSRLLRQR